MNNRICAIFCLAQSSKTDNFRNIIIYLTKSFSLTHYAHGLDNLFDLKVFNIRKCIVFHIVYHIAVDNVSNGYTQFSLT